MTYPPERHMLRDLAIETLRADDGSVLAIAPVHRHVCDDRGNLRAGVIATVIDVAGAVLALRALHPDRVATLGLEYHSAKPAREGPLVARAQILRSGSAQVVMGLEMADGHGGEDFARGEFVGSGLLSFRRLQKRSDHAPIPSSDDHPRRSTLAVGATRMTEPYLERAKLRILDAAQGSVEIENHDYVRNSFGTLNGGMVATLIDVAAEQAARARCGADLSTADLAVHYVGQAGPGPLRTRTRVIRASRDHAVCRVDLVDAGDGERLLAVGTATAVRA
jgi:uncharacterized protein (TIGR00369 family)